MRLLQSVSEFAKILAAADVRVVTEALTSDVKALTEIALCPINAKHNTKLLIEQRCRAQPLFYVANLIQTGKKSTEQLLLYHASHEHTDTSFRDVLLKN